ncbi:hypothetical protein ABZ891_22765 [Streptomyces sp. NPDC047023]|uniref:hypothetical protein n=1 Tax=Streptomyces sp. NPDC047023 TaxID=3155139 RepID=UPI0033EB0923
MTNLWDLAGEGVEERVAFAAEVRNMVWRETRRRMGYGEGRGPSTVNGLNPTSTAARRLHLAYMEVAADAGIVARHLVDDAAARAGRAGASYTQLGEAAGNLSRQAARKRWPEAVGTHWVLYTITGKEPPHGRATTLYRSEEKAVERGRTAVDEGAYADDGAIAAVVVNSAREVVWACWFNHATWGPDETELPEDLRSVPAPESPDHVGWQQRWEQYITTRP